MDFFLFDYYIVVTTLYYGTRSRSRTTITKHSIFFLILCVRRCAPFFSHRETKQTYTCQHAIRAYKTIISLELPWPSGFIVNVPDLTTKSKIMDGLAYFHLYTGFKFKFPIV